MENDDYDKDYHDFMKQKISEQHENVWVKHYNSGQILSHTFGDVKSYFHVNVGNYGDGVVALIFYPNLQSLKEDDDSLCLELPDINFDEDFAFAKKTVAAGIEKFDQEQKFTEYDIMEYFSSRFKEWRQEVPTPSQSLEKVDGEEVEFERWLDPYEFIRDHPKDVWVKYKSEPEKTLKHIFKIDGGSVSVRFQLAPPTSEEDTETAIIFNREPDGQHAVVNVETDIDTAKAFVANTIKHFDKERDMSLDDIASHLKSQFTEYQKAEHELVKKAGYVQGVCECVAAIGDGYTFGKKLLSEMNVTKDMAKKYANPETYKALEQGIFAPQHEQKQEQTHNIRR